ncbi:MAG: hypothetical protein IH977_13810 [Nitrospinae bacterium]|nr:hypothetical protein [Nitrospinota bacterium]
MTNQPDIPQPDNSGSSGLQKPAPDDLELKKAQPFKGLPMVTTIEGLASTKSRLMGGEVTSALIAGVTTQLAADYQEAKSELADLHTKFNVQRDELEETRVRCAVLEQQIHSEGMVKHLRNLCISVGTGLIGTGVYLSRSEIDEYAYGAYAVGLLLMLLSWLSGPRGAKK